MHSVLLKTTALTKNRSPGAEGLLWNEPLGLAIDATTEGGTVYIRDTTAANNRFNEPLNGWFGSAGLLTNGGTSPKLCAWNDGTLHWNPHNVILQSQTIDNASWTSIGLASITADATTAPDGTTTAEKIIESSGAGNHIRYQEPSTSSGFVYTASVYIKAAERTYCFVARSGIVNGGVHVDLTNGTLNNAEAAVLASSISDAGNGWYRVSVTATAGGTDGVSVWIKNASGTGALSYTGDGTSGLYVWGGQLNRGYTPTAYLPTTTAAKYGIPQQWDATTNQFGILSEPAATNIALRSQDFSTTWAQTDTTRTSTNNTAPDATATATLLTEGSAGTAATTQAITITANATYTISLFLKAGTATWVRIGFYVTAVTTDRVDCWYNLSTGALGTAANGGTGSGATGTITPVGGGWYRCTLTGAVGNSATGATFDLSSASADSSTTRVNSVTYYAWGGQAETGSVATTYIPTVAATVTRAADDIRVLTSAFPYSNVTNTIYSDFVLNQVDANSQVTALYLSDNDRILQFYYATDGNGVQYVNDTAQQAFVEVGVLSAGVRYQMASSSQANYFLSSLNGAAPVTDTAGTMPTSAASNLGIGSSPDGSSTDGRSKVIRRIVFVPRCLLEANLPTWRYNS